MADLNGQTSTHAAPQEPLFEQLQEDLDTLLRSSPPVFLPRPLALKDGVAEVVKGKCTHTQMHTFLRVAPDLAYSARTLADFMEWGTRSSTSHPWLGPWPPPPKGMEHELCGRKSWWHFAPDVISGDPDDQALVSAVILKTEPTAEAITA